MFEGHMPYDGDRILDFDGAIEIERGTSIKLEKADVQKVLWKKTMDFDLRKKSDVHGMIEIEIRTRPDEDETSFSGTYRVRTAKREFRGQMACSGG
jgi:hypothetical protein